MIAVSNKTEQEGMAVCYDDENNQRFLSGWFLAI
jgi:hypothetical protein